MTIKVPFDKDGNLMTHPEEYSRPLWRDNSTFPAAMTIAGIARGRSADNFILKDEAGRTYNIFLRDALDMVRATTVVNGVVSGNWTFRKRGPNYGIILARKEKE